MAEELKLFEGNRIRHEEPFIIDNQVIMKGYKNAEEFSNSITELLVLMKNLYDQLLKKVPQDKL